MPRLGRVHYCISLPSITEFSACTITWSRGECFFYSQGQMLQLPLVHFSVTADGFSYSSSNLWAVFCIRIIIICYARARGMWCSISTNLLQLREYTAWSFSSPSSSHCSSSSTRFLFDRASLWDSSTSSTLPSSNPSKQTDFAGYTMSKQDSDTFSSMSNPWRSCRFSGHTLCHPPIIHPLLTSFYVSAVISMPSLTMSVLQKPLAVILSFAVSLMGLLNIFRK